MSLSGLVRKCGNGESRSRRRPGEEARGGVHLRHSARNGSLGRGAALAIVVAAVVGLAGCGATHSSSSTTSSSQGALSPTPIPSVPTGTKPLAVLNWNLDFGEPLTMDTGKVVDFDDLFVLANLCEPLEKLLPSGQIVPDLATSIVQDSSTTYTVNVRQGVKFWNGQPLTATDVAFSLNRQLAPSLGSYYELLILGAFKSATATGPNTVKIVLNHPSSIFQRMLVTPLSMVVEKSFVQAHGSSYGTPQVGPMCTGPYQFVNWTPGQSLTIKQFPGYWDASQVKPLTSEAKFVFIGDTNTSTEALLTGEVDGEFLVPAPAVPRLKGGGGTLVNGPATLIYALNSAAPKGPGANVKIRQAVAKLVDYAGVSSSQFLGTAEVVRAIAGPNTWGTEESTYSAAYQQLPSPAQDLAAAKTLVQQSGLKNPTVVVATTSVSQGASELLDQMAQAGKQAGMTIVNRVLSVGQFGTLFTSAAARAPYSFFYSESNADIPDPLEFYDQVALPTGGENYSGYNNPTVTKLLSEANTTFNLSQRASLTVQAQKGIVQDQPWIPIVAPYLTTYLGKNIGGLQVSFPSVMYTPWLAQVGAR
jgi:peptide/nickel transport system substrate-binding protein